MENLYVQECLAQFGFTAYFETEGMYREGDYPEWDNVNLAILKSDFENVEIVDTLSPETKISFNTYMYACPLCGDSCRRVDIINSTFEMGEVMCRECADMVECDSCGDLFRESDLKSARDEYGYIVDLCEECLEEDER